MSKNPNQSPRPVTSMESWPRIALIGCGAIAESYYLPALARHPHILKNLMLVDQVLARAQELAANFRIKRCFADYHETIDMVDGVIIALPTHLHHPVSLEFLSRGVPVFCEKPLAESADKAREMVAMANDTGAALVTNYSQRLWPQFAKVKELIAGGSLGSPIEIKYQVGEVFDWPTVSGFYFNAAGSARGVLRDRGAHVMDHICWWLVGKPTVLISQNDSFGGSDAVAYVQFERNKCVGEVKLSWLSSFPCKFEIECERGSIEGDIYYPQSILLKTGSRPKKRVKLEFENYFVLGHKTIDNFIGVINNKEKPLVPGSDVLDSLIFVDECYAAATRFQMPWYEFPEITNDL